ncbi:hypothetical protein B0H14DRAFT_2646637 [Mycena olivaceomarginata]|nr:hypothetical protein B0H14DRAFT_2646637 [Mycena olivaceomarginata]
MFKDWERLKDLVKQRLVVSDSRTPVYRACDNLENLISAASLGNGSSFGAALPVGAFTIARRIARNMIGATVAIENPVALVAYLLQSPFTMRDRAFIRALMHHDYTVNLDWRLRELMFMNEYPDTPFLTVFDYRRGKAEIKLHQLDTFAHRTGLKLGAEWDDDVARTTQSGGRMALHLFCASEAGRCRYWIVPLRSASATVHEGLRRLAAGLPRKLGTWNIPALMCQIQNLIDSGGKEIH